MTGLRKLFFPFSNSINNAGEVLSIETLLSPALNKSSSSVPPGCSEGIFGFVLRSIRIQDVSIENTPEMYFLTDAAIFLPSTGPFSDDPTKVIVEEGFLYIRSPSIFNKL